jgi:hypothetical protein
MSTVTQIKLALKARLATLTDVDQAEIDSYLPPVLTKRIALVIPPFGQETRVDRLTSQGRFALADVPVMQSHRLRCEFWVKIDTGNLAQTLRRASDIPLEAIRLLMADQELGGAVSRVGNFGAGDNRWSITSETIDRPVEIAGVPYIVVVVNVPVIDYAEA